MHRVLASDMSEYTDRLDASGVRRIVFEQVASGWIATARTVTGEVLGIGRGHSIRETRVALDHELADVSANRSE